MKNVFLAVKYVSAVLGGALLVYAVLTVAAPLVTHAQTNCTGNCVSAGLGQISGPFGGSSGLLKSGSVLDLIINVIKVMLTFTGAIAVLFVIIGGYQYITSAGNAEAAEKGRATVVNALIGIVVIVLSYVIINVVVNTVSCNGGGSSFFGITLC